MIEYVQRARASLDVADPAAVAEVISAQLLAPASDDSLFELMVGFRLIDELESRGFVTPRRSAMTGTHRPFAHLERTDVAVNIWWQRSIWELLPGPIARESSTYAQILDQAGMRRSSLRPDFSVTTSDGRLLMIGVKHTLRQEYTPERRGIIDALSYLKDDESVIEGLPIPHALVVAWNATGRPGQSPVMVADEEQIGEALALFLSESSIATQR